jgi:hypothetical protein
MASVTSGVYPVYNNIFKVGKNGLASTTSDMVTIADCETFSVSNDTNIEEWTPMNLGGDRRALKTGRGFTISISGKRNVGDEGNDYIASTVWVTGQQSETKFEWEMPNGDKVSFNAVINVTSLGGDSTAVDVLEFDLISNGEIVYTPAA